jgi:myo-inositol 2-dehydrogenase/D-chiro-inositol 1-dehydrogenase
VLREHGATFYEQLAFMDRLEGEVVNSATVIQGLWAMIVGSAAQKSMASKQAVEIEEFLRHNNLENYLGTSD